jgi:hypothetical protein
MLRFDVLIVLGWEERGAVRGEENVAVWLLVTVTPAVVPIEVAPVVAVLGPTIVRGELLPSPRDSRASPHLQICHMLRPLEPGSTKMDGFTINASTSNKEGPQMPCTGDTSGLPAGYFPSSFFL